MSKFLGVCFAVAGNCLIGLSFVAQKHAHINNKQGISYLRLPWWWIGMITMGIGECGNLMAYAYAPASLVSPLGAVSLVVNAPLAHLILKDRMTKRSFLGCLCCIVGGISIVLMSPEEEKQFTVADYLGTEGEAAIMANPLFIAFAVINILVALVVMISRVKSVLAYITVCSTLACISVLGVKGLSSFAVLTIEGKNQFYNPFPFALLVSVIVMMIVQLHYLNKAMIIGGAHVVMPIYYVLFTGLTVTGGVILYDEWEGIQWYQVMLFVCGFIFTFLGVYLTTSDPKPEQQEEPASTDVWGEVFESDEDEEDASRGELRQSPKWEMKPLVRATTKQTATAAILSK